VLANSLNVTPYINDAPTGNMNAAAIGAAGGSQPHNNFQPYLCVDFIISLFGIFPSPT
jgi:microcystin-dependent protein